MPLFIATVPAGEGTTYVQVLEASDQLDALCTLRMMALVGMLPGWPMHLELSMIRPANDDLEG